MRKKILLILTAATGFFCHGKPGLKLGTKIQCTPENLILSQNLQGDFRGFDFSAAYKTRNEAGHNPSPEDLSENTDFSWGIKARRKQEREGKYSAKLMAGTLHYSGAFSVLTNPLFTLENSLGIQKLSKPGLKADLPGSSTSARPFSSFFSIGHSFSRTSLGLQCFLTSTASWGASATMEKEFRHSPVKNLNMGIAFTQSRFAKTGQTTWFLHQRNIPATTLAHILAQCSVRTDTADLSTEFALAQNPTGGAIPFLRMQGQIRLDPFSIQTKLFWTPDTFITSSLEYSRTPLQFSVNPQIDFGQLEIPLRAGLIASLEQVRDFYTKELYSREKLMLEVHWNFSSISTSVQGEVCHREKDEQWSWDSAVSVGIPAGPLSITSDASLRQSGGTTTFSLKEKLQLKKSFLESVSLSFSDTFRNGKQDDKSLKISANLEKQCGILQLKGSLKVNVPF